VQIQILPDGDPNGCLSVGLKPIDLYPIITQTSFPVILQAVVQVNCENTELASLQWSSDTWKFWDYYGNNNTIMISRMSLNLLDPSQPYMMTVKAYYTVGVEDDFLYLATYTFNLMAKSSDLVSVVEYTPVFNVNSSDQFTLDATESFDPSAPLTGTNDIPITCTIVCPSPFSRKSICRELVGCYQQLSSTEIREASNFYSDIRGQI